MSVLTGVILRDTLGVAQTRFVTGNKILRILKSKGLAPDIPEDLHCMIKTAIAIRKHLDKFRSVSPSHWAREEISCFSLSFCCCA